MQKRWRYYIDRDFQNQFVFKFSMIILFNAIVTLGLLWLVKEKSYSLLPEGASVLVHVDVENALSLSLLDGKPVLDDETGKNYFPLKMSEGGNPPKLYNAFDLYIIPIFVTSILNVIIVSVFSIFFSHKMAGPIKRIKNTLDAFVNQKEVSLIYLRKGDFFKDLAELINKAILIKKNEDK